MNTTIGKWGNSFGVSKKPRKKTAKDIIAEFYHKPYAEVLAMANSGQIEQDTELDRGEDVGNEVLE